MTEQEALTLSPTTAPPCPTAPLAEDGTPHTIIGCGSTNTVQDEPEPQLWDCLDCGIWLNPGRERA